MLNFVNRCPISYLTVIVDRREAADFICSMELLRIKQDEKRLSRSEESFFYKPQELKKTFLKSVDKKKL